MWHKNIKLHSLDHPFKSKHLFHSLNRLKALRSAASGTKALSDGVPPRLVPINQRLARYGGAARAAGKALGAAAQRMYASTDGRNAFAPMDDRKLEMVESGGNSGEPEELQSVAEQQVRTRRHQWQFERLAKRAKRLKK